MESQPPPPPAGPDPGATPPVAPTKYRWGLALGLILGGILLAVGGCGFFLTYMNSSRTENLALVGGIGFFAGIIMFLIGGLTLLVYAATPARHHSYRIASWISSGLRPYSSTSVSYESPA